MSTSVTVAEELIRL